MDIVLEIQFIYLDWLNIRKLILHKSLKFLGIIENLELYSNVKTLYLQFVSHKRN